MRSVFDANVLVSALLSAQSIPRRALDFALERGEVLLSLDVLAELSGVLGRKQIRLYVDDEDARRFMAALAREADWVEVISHIEACRDPKDNKYLELAVSGHADYLVTGDSDLLILTPFQGIVILTPRAFLADRSL